MRRAWAKFLFSFFSSKFAVMLIRSTAIACNVFGLGEVAEASIKEKPLKRGAVASESALGQN